MLFTSGTRAVVQCVRTQSDVSTGSRQLVYCTSAITATRQSTVVGPAVLLSCLCTQAVQGCITLAEWLATTHQEIPDVATSRNTP